MYLVGKIDIEIYNCITKDITTDEVIITDERIQHIKEHHPNNYEQYYSYMRSIIENPEYIIEANKPNTALILKSFSNGNETFKTVLRLITSSDNSKFKNSIITFMKINEKEFHGIDHSRQRKASGRFAVIGPPYACHTRPYRHPPPRALYSVTTLSMRE